VIVRLEDSKVWLICAPRSAWRKIWTS